MAILPNRTTGGKLGKNDNGTLRVGCRMPSDNAPNGAVIGDLWYDTTVSTLRAWNGTVWVPVGSSAVGPWELNDQTLFLRTDADGCHRIKYVNGTQGDLGSMDGVAVIGNGRSALFSNGCGTGSAGGNWRFVWDTNGDCFCSENLYVGNAANAVIDSTEAITTSGPTSGISMRDRDNAGLRSVVYSSGGRGRLWRGADVLIWNQTEIQLEVRTLGPRDRPLVEANYTAAWAGGGTEIGVIMQAGTVVLNYGAGNSNIPFPTSFPSTIVTCVAINGDSGGSAGGPATCMSVSNPGLGQCGTSHVQSTTGAGINGNVRVNFIAVGY